MMICPGLTGKSNRSGSIYDKSLLVFFFNEHYLYEVAWYVHLTQIANKVCYQKNTNPIYFLYCQ